MYGYEIFHEDLMQSLIRSVRNVGNSHAYIFEGGKGLGVLNAARLFAAALTCKNTDTAPCGSCRSCVESKANTNPDIIYVNSGNKKSIGADVMRDLELDASVKPFDSARKVYIFEDGSELTEAAQNVFLKTLEEPPSYAVFIIVTENAEALLQTIHSRAVIVHFPYVSDEAARGYISEKYPNETERLEFLVKYCAGAPKIADSIIADPEFETLRGAALEKLPALLSGNALNAFELKDFIEENKDSFTLLADFWISFLRDILLLQTGAGDGLINIDKKDALRGIAARFEPKKIVEMTDRLIKTEKMAARYVNIKSLSLWLAL